MGHCYAGACEQSWAHIILTRLTVCVSSPLSLLCLFAPFPLFLRPLYGTPLSSSRSNGRLLSARASSPRMQPDAGERNGVLDVPDKARRCAGASCAGARDARGTGVGTSCTRCAVLGRGGGGALLSSARVLCGSEAAASNTRPALSAATAAVAFPACWSPAVASADAGLALAPSATASLGQLHVVMQCQGR